MFKNLIPFLLFLFLLACKRQVSDDVTEIKNSPNTKYLLDSTLTALQKFDIGKDTIYGAEDRDNRKAVDVKIQTIAPSKHILAFISLQETDTSHIQVFIFAVSKPQWKFLGSINDLGRYQSIGEPKLIDMDFDHKKDLLIPSYGSASRIVSSLDCFEFDEVKCRIGRKKIRELQTSEKYGDFLGLSIDTLEKTITCYTDGGFMGTEEARVYHWHQDTLQLFKQLDMLVCKDTFFIYHKSDFEEDKDINEGDTIFSHKACLNEYELMNGKMKLIKQQKIFHEEAYRYFQKW